MAKKKSEPVEQPETIAADPEPELTPRADELRYAVALTLPFGVLVALLEPEHALADAEGAVRLGLLGAGGSLSLMGKLVAAGFDQTAVRHKMNAAWRAAHNREVDNG